MRSLVAIALLAAVSLTAQVLTSQYDNARTGAILTETTLTPANVNSAHFGKRFSLAVDGDLYGQPLFVPGLEIPGKGRHDVIFVATEHDSVYAFDATGVPAEPLWKVNFLNTSAGVTTVRAQDVRCPFITPEIGITPTPVIDYESGTLYVLARTKEGKGLTRPRFVQKLHALAITTGAEKFGGPVEIKANGFDPLRELPRAGLLLDGGQLYLTWGSSCDAGPYHGWVMAYDAHTLRQTAVFNTSPDAEESGIWQSDNAPAADGAGNIFVATGNGKFDARAKGRDYGDSLLKLDRGLVVRDYFTPADESEMNRKDNDLGSGGPVLLPDHKLLIGGKDGRLFVVDRDHPGESVQSVRMLGGIYSAPAYWNGHVYVLARRDFLRDYKWEKGTLSKEPVTGKQTFANSGATPAISANGTRNGIVWFIESKDWNGADRPAVLHAFDARDVTREIYSSEQVPNRDRAGMTLRFTIPTVANGRVYVNAKRKLEVYGLLGK